MARDTFPMKDHFGATRQDMNRGYSDGMHPNEKKRPTRIDDLVEEDEKRKEFERSSGFAGRPDGWER